MTIAEKLNKIDHYCLDNNKDFRDLRSLYESIKPKLSAQDRTDLKKFISNPNANAEDIEIKLQSLSNKNEAIDPKCLEKKSLDEANYMGYNYPYEVHWINHRGNDVLLGANKELFQAELTARNQIKQLLSNPWLSNKDKLLTLENVYIYNSETGDEDCMTDDLMWFIEKARDRLNKKTESLDESMFDDFEDDTDSVFVEVDHKQVHDSSGFITDYTMYQNTDTGEFVCVFGDTDLYRPEDGEWDAGPFETEEEAWEWFDCYNGFDDEDLDESVNKIDEYYDPIEDIDSADMIGKLAPGDKFKNRKGVVITIVEPQKDGTVQFQIGDEVRSGSEKSLQRMLYRNNYMRIDDIDESLIMPDGTTFTKPIWYKNYKIKQNRSSDEFLSVFDQFGEVESDGFTSVEAAKEYIDNLIEDAMYDDWQSGNVGKFNKYPDDDFDEPLPFEGYSKKEDTSKSLTESIDDEKLNVVIYSDERPQQVISGNGFKTIQVRDKLDWFSAPLAEVYEEMKNFYSDPYYDGCTCTVSGKGWSAPLQDVLDYYENKDSYLGESYADIFSGVGAAAGTALGGITPIPFDEVAGASVGGAAGRAIGGVFDAIHQHRQNKAKRDDGVYEAYEGYNHVCQMTFDIAVNDPDAEDAILDYITELFDTYSINNALDVEAKLLGCDVISMDHASSESLKESLTDIEQQCKIKFNDLKTILLSGVEKDMNCDEADVLNRVKAAFKAVGGRSGARQTSPTYVQFDGVVPVESDPKGYTIGGSISGKGYIIGDLTRLAEDLTMAYNVKLGGQSGYTPNFIKKIQNESLRKRR